jgi:CAAX protease family protein
MQLPPWRQSLRNSRLIIALDLALVAVVFAGVHYHWRFIVFSRTPYLLALAWISMRLRGIGWRDLGLRFDQGWQRLIMVGIAAGFAMEALELFVTQPYLVQLTCPRVRCEERPSPPQGLPSYQLSTWRSFC